MTRRFKPPWSADERPGCYAVVDAEGTVLTRVYFRDSISIGTNPGEHLTRDEARRLAAGFARLPALLGRE